MNTLKPTLKPTISSSNQFSNIPNELEYIALGTPRVIFFRPNFTSDTELVSSLQNDSSKNLLIYDSNLPDNMVSKVYKAFKACEIFAIPSGESSKNWETLELIINKTNGSGLDRTSKLIALGGGATGDITGLAASLYMRGISWINIPTTSLAQADSAIGGKTAINTDYGKNMVGTFHPADITVMDPELLETLPERELKSGAAEIIKHAILADHKLFEWLESVSKTLISNKQNLFYALRRSCELKLALIGQDWLDKTGAREQLNLGHTFAHALEKLVDNQEILNHGEAVAIGLSMVANKSAKLGYCSNNYKNRIQKLLLALGFDLNHEQYTKGHEQQFKALLSRDKKHKGNIENFVYIHEKKP